jgi:hypothetical protein
VPNHVFGGKRVRGFVGGKMCPEQEAESLQGPASCHDVEGKGRVVGKKKVGEERVVVSTVAGSEYA